MAKQKKVAMKPLVFSAGRSRFYSVQEAAVELDRSVGFIMSIVRSGKLIAVQRDGHWQIESQSLDTWARGLRKKAGASDRHRKGTRIRAKIEQRRRAELSAPVSDQSARPAKRNARTLQHHHPTSYDTL